MKNNALGRGLDSLLPDIPSGQADGVVAIPMDDIDVNQKQPRKAFSEKTLNTLAESIRTVGVIQPIIVVPNGVRYRIVAGERRFRAAKLAGLKVIPCLVQELSPSTQMEYALIENLQREDLNPIEIAQGIFELMQTCHYTQEECAKRVGKSRPAVANLLRLLSLPEEVQQQVRDKRISEGHARVLAGVDNRETQINLLRQCLLQGWTVRQLEQAASKKGEERVVTPRRLAPELQDMQERMQAAFGVRSQISGTPKKGKITLAYYSTDELDHLYELLEALERQS